MIIQNPRNFYLLLYAKFISLINYNFSVFSFNVPSEYKLPTNETDINVHFGHDDFEEGIDIYFSP